MDFADRTFPGRRWRPGAQAGTGLRPTKALWISVAVHGALIISGLSLAGAVIRPGAASDPAPRIVLESHAPVSPLPPMTEAAPAAITPRAPTPPEPPLVDLATGEPTETAPPAPKDDAPREPEPEPRRDWRPFDGPVEARMRLPQARPHAAEQPAAAATDRPLAVTSVALTDQREEVPASQTARTASRKSDAPVVMPVPSRRLARRLKRIAENYAGEFILEIEVDVDGSVLPGVKLLSASGPRFLTASIIDALESGRFEPATRAGRPVRMADKIKIVGGAVSTR